MGRFENKDLTLCDSEDAVIDSHMDGGQVGGTGTGSLEEAERLFKQKKYATALPIYRNLAEQGNLDAQFRLGYMYHCGLGTNSNSEEAGNWYRRVALAGEPEAEYFLGVLADEQDDFTQSIEWFQRSAAQGYTPPLFRLGMAFECGRGVPTDRQQALSYLNQAVGRGHVYAEIALGTILRREARGPGEWLRAVCLGLRGAFRAIWLTARDADANIERLQH